MKGLIWIIILFAVAVGLAIAATFYSGNMYLVVNQTMIRVSLNAFIIGLLVVMVFLYLLIGFLAGILNVPGKMQRFGTARQERKANAGLNAAGLAFFEGKFQKAEQEAAKVLANKEVGDNRTLALMLGAHAADQMDDITLRDRYLQEIEQLPQKNQLSRYLLLAESALSRQDYDAARNNIASATQINPTLTRLVKLQLRYAQDHGDAVETLEKTGKLLKAGAINESEALQNQDWAYHRLLAQATTVGGLKACLKRIPDSEKSDSLCAPIAEKYAQLGLYSEAVDWVGKYYPQTRQSALLPAFVHSVRLLKDREQRKAIDMADGWLKQQPDDSDLLMCLGQLAYDKQLWGKAQGYLEASLAVKPSLQARLALAKVMDETGNGTRADELRMLALQDAAQQENAALPVATTSSNS